MARTFHTYPDLITEGGRLAATDWGRSPLTEAVAATLAHCRDAVILLAIDGNDRIRAHAPGGMAA